jgi:hypothetical protein
MAGADESLKSFGKKKMETVAWKGEKRLQEE